MSDYRKRLTAAAEALGFTLEGTGRHLRFVHDNGAVTAPRTPSDHRAVRNVIATMERVSGRKIPRPGAARYRNQRRKPGLTDTPPTPTPEHAERRERILADAHRLSDKFSRAVSSGDVDAARAVLVRWGVLTRRADRAGVDLPDEPRITVRWEE